MWSGQGRPTARRRRRVHQAPPLRWCNGRRPIASSVVATARAVAACARARGALAPLIIVSGHFAPRSGMVGANALLLAHVWISCDWFVCRSARPPPSTLARRQRGASPWPAPDAVWTRRRHRRRPCPRRTSRWIGFVLRIARVVAERIVCFESTRACGPHRLRASCIGPDSGSTSSAAAIVRAAASSSMPSLQCPCTSVATAACGSLASVAAVVARVSLAAAACGAGVRPQCAAAGIRFGNSALAEVGRGYG